jgi:thioredoxin-dependent peroxiredoxin
MSHIQTGSHAPQFSLLDQLERTHSIAGYKGSWVILYFYPKDATPGCTLEAEQFRDLFAEFDALKIGIFGISPDSTKSHKKFCDALALPFPLLSDEGSVVCKQYGVWVEKSMYGKVYMGVERTTVLIAPDGTIAHIYTKVKPDGHAQAVLETLKDLIH